MAVVTQVTKPANDISLDFASPRENDIRVCMYTYMYTVDVHVFARPRRVTRKRVRERKPGVAGPRCLFERVRRADEDFNARPRVRPHRVDR